MNFLDIPMDGLGDVNELDNYLSQGIEKVIAWWWDHQKVYPKLSAMAFDYLSVPGNVHLLCLVRTCC
jgi:hAT family C-terminal dimerisation region